ncbi:hypothetical protein ABTM14_19575, partial [Acinetobacter baumannii]
AHPFALFMALCGVAGHMAPLGPGMLPPIFRGYDHCDPVRAFTPVLAFLDRMIDAVSASYSVLRFSENGAAFELPLNPAWLRRDLVIGVRVRP